MTMISKEVVFCVVNYSLAGDFFIRLAKSDSERQYIIVTSSLSIFAKSKMAGLKVKLISVFSSDNGRQPIIDEEKCIEYHLGALSKNKIKSMAAKLYTYCSDEIERLGDVKLICFLVWNGQGVLGEVVRAIKKDSRHEVSTAFLEIANLPGKIFVDAEGVNKSSSLYQNPDHVLKYSRREFDYRGWRENYIKEKLSPKVDSSIPQKSLSLSINFFQVLDMVGFLLTGYRTFAWTSVTRRLNHYCNKVLSLKRRENTPDDIGELADYVFFPMQVKNDTQILLNSKVDNIQALKVMLGKTSDCYVVKPHPADLDSGYIYDFARKNSGRVAVSEENTYKLLLGSKKVVVINSTVGFEAMVMGKDVEFLGFSFYDDFSEDHMAAYVGGYLVDVDFFSGREISKSGVDAIFRRAS